MHALGWARGAPSSPASGRLVPSPTLSSVRRQRPVRRATCDSPSPACCARAARGLDRNAGRRKNGGPLHNALFAFCWPVAPGAPPPALGFASPAADIRADTRTERRPARPRIAAFARASRTALSGGAQPSAWPPSWEGFPPALLTPGNGHRDAVEPVMGALPFSVPRG